MPNAIQRIIDDVVAEIETKAVEIEASAERKDEDAAPGPIGIAIALPDGSVLSAGAATTGFPIQSISKLFALDLALEAIGDAVFERVGREPSGDPFNSIIDLERTKGLPRNPFVNAGALVVVDILVENDANDSGRDAVTALVRDRAIADIGLHHRIGVGHQIAVVTHEAHHRAVEVAAFLFRRHHRRVMRQAFGRSAVPYQCGHRIAAAVVRAVLD